MRSRAYRSIQGRRRKAIGAVIVGGVLVAAGFTGVQFASASTTTKAANIVTVDGQQFDVSNCGELDINGGAVLCDGAQLTPQDAQDANAGALASAQALEAACDQFGADAQAANDARLGGHAARAKELMREANDEIKAAAIVANGGVAPTAPVYVAPAGVTYVAPTYATPGPGYVWAWHPRYGWGWNNPRWGWHRGWY